MDRILPSSRGANVSGNVGEVIGIVVSEGPPFRDSPAFEAVGWEADKRMIIVPGDGGGVDMGRSSQCEVSPVRT